MSFLKRFGKSLAIDLGTSNTLIYSPHKGLVAEAPSVVLYRSSKQDGVFDVVDSVGEAAKKAMGFTPEHLKSVKPVRSGVINDFTGTQHLIKKLLPRRGFLSSFFGHGIMLVTVPAQATQVERRAVREAALEAGASDVWLVPEVAAGAVGAGIPIGNAFSSMVVDIGGGTSQVGVFSLAGSIYTDSRPIGGDYFDQEILMFFRRHFGILIDEAMAEEIKISVGNAKPEVNDLSTEVTGLCAVSSSPKSQVTTSNDIFSAIEPLLEQIVGMVKASLHDLPPRLCSSLAQNGIVMIGGGSLLPNIDRYLAERIGLPVHLADDPQRCVAKGAGIILENLDQYSDLLSQA
jgi:rod shape-determining protein MreB and related proteins